MKQFPKKLVVPPKVEKTRTIRVEELVFSASWGIVIRFGIIVFELFGVWLFGSAALLLDAIASLVDVFSSLLLVFFIKFAARPPDKNHPFGHGRFEPLVGFQLGLLLLGIGGFMFIQQMFQVNEVKTSEIIDSRAWIFPVIAVVLLEICYQLIVKTARKQKSPALEADAFHYRVDGLTSLFAAIALIFAAFVPEWSHFIDHTGAIVISLLMILMGLYAARNNLNQIVDRAPDESFFVLVADAAQNVHGVLGTEKIGIQLYGPDAHVDIDVEVDPLLSVERAHKISQKVRLEIQKEWPAVRDVTVHIEPYYPNDH